MKYIRVVLTRKVAIIFYVFILGFSCDRNSILLTEVMNVSCQGYRNTQVSVFNLGILGKGDCKPPARGTQVTPADVQAKISPEENGPARLFTAWLVTSHQVENGMPDGCHSSVLRLTSRSSSSSPSFRIYLGPGVGPVAVYLNQSSLSSGLRRTN